MTWPPIRGTTLLMKRRNFLSLATLPAAASLASAAPPAAPWPAEDDGLKITSVRLVTTRPKRPVPSYPPAPGSWSTGGVEVANPMSIYPKYKATRSLLSVLDITARSTNPK